MIMRKPFMKKMQFSVEIKAPKEEVWKTLWEEKTFRDWANIIDEGMYLVGEMKEGNEVQFISSVSGYGVTSLIERLIPNEFVSFRQMTDTKDSGAREREMEWTGGKESYSLTEKDVITTLTVELDVPHEQMETFKVRFPKALERVKVLTEV
ncbi:MAG: SRPBCC domain-containing protein [Candidatus Hermodarchaeota archaeon]